MATTSPIYFKFGYISGIKTETDSMENIGPITNAV